MFIKWVPVDVAVAAVVAGLQLPVAAAAGRVLACLRSWPAGARDPSPGVNVINTLIFILRQFQPYFHLFVLSFTGLCCTISKIRPKS